MDEFNVKIYRSEFPTEKDEQRADAMIIINGSEQHHIRVSVSQEDSDLAAAIKALEYLFDNPTDAPVMSKSQ